MDHARFAGEASHVLVIAAASPPMTSRPRSPSPRRMGPLEVPGRHRSGGATELRDRRVHRHPPRRDGAPHGRPGPGSGDRHGVRRILVLGTTDAYQLSQDRQQLFKRTKVDSDPTTAEARAAVAAGQIPAPAKRRKARSAGLSACPRGAEDRDLRRMGLPLGSIGRNPACRHRRHTFVTSGRRFGAKWPFFRRT